MTEKEIHKIIIAELTQIGVKKISVIDPKFHHQKRKPNAIDLLVEFKGLLSISEHFNLKKRLQELTGVSVYINYESTLVLKSKKEIINTAQLIYGY